MTPVVLLVLSKPALAACNLLSVPADALTGNRIEAAPLRLEPGHLLEVDHHSAPSGSMQPWVVAWVFLAGVARKEVLSESDTKIRFASHPEQHSRVRCWPTPIPLRKP